MIMESRYMIVGTLSATVHPCVEGEKPIVGRATSSNIAVFSHLVSAQRTLGSPLESAPGTAAPRHSELSRKVMLCPSTADLRDPLPRVVTAQPAT